MLKKPPRKPKQPTKPWLRDLLRGTIDIAFLVTKAAAVVVQVGEWLT